MVRTWTVPARLLSALLVLAFTSCSRNRPPDVPAVPDGPFYCLPDTTYAFKTVATDPDGDNVGIDFDWGDSSVSLCLLPATGGETISATHSWRDTGTYRVRMQATDAEQLRSGWSRTFTVLVLPCRPPNMPHVISGPDTVAPYSSCSFATSALHPDGNPVSIRFAWDDGDTSEWSAFVQSGDTVTMSHAWTATGTYGVRAQARDIAGAQSLWNLPHNVLVKTDTLRKWRVRLGSNGWSLTSPAVSSFGTVYVGTAENSLYAVNADGTVKWRFRTNGAVGAAPAIAANGTVYFGCYDGWLYAVRSNGTLRWRFPVGGSSHLGPAIAADGTIYIGSNRDTLYAVNPDGTLKWYYRSAAGVRTAPVVGADGTVYFGSSSSFCALRPDGGIKWEHATGNDYPSDPAIGANGTLYFGSYSHDPHIYALNSDGTAQWTMSSSVVASSPAIDAWGTIYFGSTAGWLYLVNPDGTLKRRDATGSAVSTAATIAADGLIYFGSADSSLYAVNPNGTLAWRYQIGGSIQSPPTIAPDWTIYITGNDGCLYALNGTHPLANSPWPKDRHDLSNTGRVGGAD